MSFRYHIYMLYNSTVKSEYNTTDLTLCIMVRKHVHERYTLYSTRSDLCWEFMRLQSLCKSDQVIAYIFNGNEFLLLYHVCYLTSKCLPVEYASHIPHPLHSTENVLFDV